MDTTIRDFYSSLDAEEAKIHVTLKDDNLGILLRTAITELDWYAYNYFSKTNRLETEQAEQYYILRMGVIRLVQLALQSRSSFDAPFFMYVRDYENATAVLEISAALGMIQHGRRVAQSAASGMCKIIKLSEKDFHITVPAVLPDLEHYEKAISNHYRNSYHEALTKLLHENGKDKIEGYVDELLDDLVFPFLGKWIGYDADPLLDDYFFSMAAKTLRTEDGIDSFHHTACFGGIPYLHYTLALTYLISLHEKHRRFAEALANKNSNIQLHNILTITGETSIFIPSIVLAVNKFGAVYEGFSPLNLESASRIFELCQ